MLRPHADEATELRPRSDRSENASPSRACVPRKSVTEQVAACYWKARCLTWRRLTRTTCSSRSWGRWRER
ncbi:hypothetical protein PUN28_011101 [Cardiocondyla obscurior]|uniref:Uncharacterized protein n=1 Tax=Cardiocondyla obscurior TaxID=286306 RepID=A0AAW2FJK3_9HYME